MPNHCENKLTIDGTAEMLKTIVDKHIQPTTGTQKDYGDYFLDFNTIIPYPEEYKQADRALSEERGFRDVFSEEGYWWCVNHWGTKWNSYCVSYSQDESRLSIYFDTAWSPPEPIALELSGLYPDALVTLEYSEEGEGFAGEYVCKGGEVKTDNSWEI